MMLQKIHISNKCKVAQLYSTLILTRKCFVSTKSAYYNDFWRITWHWL